MRRRPVSRRGFTLVELMVSLVAGLVVVIAVIALGKTSTLAFHEQARMMQTEQALRTATDRLRSDLSRASYMGTGNGKLAMYADQNGVTRVPYSERMAYVLSGGNPLRYPGQDTLQGIRVEVGGSFAATALGSTANALNPDSIVIMGNLMTDDQYDGLIDGALGACGGPRIRLQPADPGVLRLLNAAPTAAAAAQQVQNAFTPAIGRRFFARIVDDQGCQQYVHVQDAGATGPLTPFVDVCPDATGRSILTPTDTGGISCGIATTGSSVARLRISPVHRVRWYIAPNTVPALAPLPNSDDFAGTQYMLYREILDATGASLPPPPDGPRPQIVAEYAVDLKFGIVVENYLPPSISVFDMDANAAEIALWTGPAGVTNYGLPGPQRVRAVRFRIGVRTALADRKFNLADPAATPYPLRYCVNPALGCGGSQFVPNFARLRSIYSEVALVNQARMDY